MTANHKHRSGDPHSRGATAGCIVLLMMAMGLAACTSAPMRPDLERMYRVAAQSPDDTPVILVPGLFGSKLRDRVTGVEVWPGAWNKILFSDYHEIELKFDEAQSSGGNPSWSSGSSIQGPSPAISGILSNLKDEPSNQSEEASTEETVAA